MKLLFKIKDKNLYPACKIYYGECQHCRDNYIGETARNTVTRWSEHNPDHKSEPAEHIKRNIEHVFNWKILCPAPSQKHLRKNLEWIFIALYKPSLNDQKSFVRLMLFRSDYSSPLDQFLTFRLSDSLLQHRKRWEKKRNYLQKINFYWQWWNWDLGYKQMQCFRGKLLQYISFLVTSNGRVLQGTFCF